MRKSRSFQGAMILGEAASKSELFKIIAYLSGQNLLR